MTEQSESKRETPSLRLTKDPSDRQGQTHWNGNYGKFLGQRLRTQAMEPSRSTTLDQTSLAKLGELLLRCTGIIGTKTNLCTKQCDELVVLSGTDGDAS